MPDWTRNTAAENPVGTDGSRHREGGPDIDFRSLVENLSDLVCLHEPDGTYTWVSPSVKRILGYEPSELIGKNPYELFHPEDAHRIRESTHEPALEGEGNIFIRYRLRHRDGHYVWLETLTQPHLDDDGRVVRLQTSSRDISEQKRIEHALRESEERYRAVINTLAEGLVVHGSDGRIIACNPSAREILNLSEEELLGAEPSKALSDAVDENGQPLPLERQPVIRTLRSGESCRDVIIGMKLHESERRTWIAINAQPFSQGDEQLVVVSFRDITEWRRTRRELNLLAKVFQSSSEAILITDADRRVVALNQAFTRLTGYTGEDLIGKPSSVLRAGDHPPEFYEAVWEELEAHGHWRGETWNRSKDGHVYPVWLSFTALRDRQGKITHYISLSSDISERHARDEHQRFLATHDQLTGLANRALAYDRIEMEIHRSQRESRSFAVLFIDLDDFKPVNDRYGHRVGDLLLRKVAGRLHRRVRASDTVSRLGGDEFIIVLAAITHRQDAEEVAQELAERLAEPYRVEDRELTIAASIGVSVFPECGSDPEALIHAADLAMYDAKGARGRVASAAPTRQE